MIARKSYNVMAKRREGMSGRETIATPNSSDKVEKGFRRLSSKVRVVLSGGDKSNYDDGHSRSHEDIQIREPVESDGTRIYHELLSFLHEHTTSTADSCEMFWDEFLSRLKVFENTSVEFRKSCLFQMRDGFTIFHEVCTLNPPVSVVKLLMDIIPTSRNGRQFNHLGCTPKRFGSEYPLHLIARYGGTLDVVKLLIDADPGRQTLKPNSKNSVYHVLVENQGYHEPDEFTGILQYLVSIIEDFCGSPLLQENKRGQTPLLLLSESLAKPDSDFSITQLLHQHDFVFVAKATCYHYFLSKGTESQEVYKSSDCNDRRRAIDDISLSRVFTICSTPTCSSSLFLKEILTADVGCFEKKIMERLAIQFERLESLGAKRRNLDIVERRKSVTIETLENILKPCHGASGGCTEVPLEKDKRVKELMKRYSQGAGVDQKHRGPTPDLSPKCVSSILT